MGNFSLHKKRLIFFDDDLLIAQENKGLALGDDKEMIVRMGMLFRGTAESCGF